MVDAELERSVPLRSPTTAITGVVDLDRFRPGSWRGRQRRSSGAHAIPGTGSVARVVGVRAMNPLLDRLEGELLGRGLVTRDSVDRWTDRHADEVGPRHGAQAVARVWGSGRHLDATAAGAAVLGRCACGRRWRYVPDTPTVRNVVLPGTPRCTGWRVLGAPPIRYREPDARTGRQVTFWSDDATTHHLVVPLRPIEARDAGPFELAALVSRTALRGFEDTPPPPTATPAEIGCGLPGYAHDERALDSPWELRVFALLLATLTDSPDREPSLRAEVERAAKDLPVRRSIYVAWLRALLVGPG